MLRQVQADELLFPTQPLAPRNLLPTIQERDRCIGRHGEQVEQRRLARRHVPLVALPVLEGDIQRGEQRGRGAEGRHRVRLDQ
jgi:hypothetical protein